MERFDVLKCLLSSQGLAISAVVPVDLLLASHEVVWELACMMWIVARMFVSSVVKIVSHPLPYEEGIQKYQRMEERR